MEHFLTNHKKESYASLMQEIKAEETGLLEDEMPCIVCNQKLEAHLPKEACPICYGETLKERMITGYCDSGKECKSCWKCMTIMLTTQVEYSRTDFNCQCSK